MKIEFEGYTVYLSKIGKHSHRAIVNLHLIGSVGGFSVESDLILIDSNYSKALRNLSSKLDVVALTLEYMSNEPACSDVEKLSESVYSYSLQIGDFDNV